MNKKAIQKAEVMATVIKAIAHPSRVCIINELAKGECCVCELTETVGSDISTVSKHLSLLKSAGLVEVDKRGTKVFYKLLMPCAAQFFKCIDQLVTDNANRKLGAIRNCKK
jgi:DNA-binding transcriptional ArsR family regulator